MRNLGMGATVGAGLLMIATMAPVTAQAAVPVPAGPTTKVSTDCIGRGTIAMKQVELDSGATRVVVSGHDVHNGRWVGGFSPDPDTTDGEVDLEATAVGREFRTVGTAHDVTAETIVSMLQRSGRACTVGQTVRPKSTILSSFAIVLVARHPRVGELTTRGLVQGCDNGSRWRFAVAAKFGDAGIGYGGGGLVCRDHVVTVPRTRAGFDGDLIDAAPEELSLVVRSGGDVRRISYRTWSP